MEVNYAGSINKRRAVNGEEALWRWEQGRRTEDGTGAAPSAVSPGRQVLGTREAGAEDRSREAASEVETVAVREVRGPLVVSGIVAPCVKPAERGRLGFSLAPGQPETDSGASTEGPDHATSLD